MMEFKGQAMELTRELTRAGIVMQPGTVIDVPFAKVEWYERNQVAKRVEIFIPPDPDDDGVSDIEE